MNQSIYSIKSSATLILMLQGESFLWNIFYFLNFEVVKLMLKICTLFGSPLLWIRRTTISYFSVVILDPYLAGLRPFRVKLFSYYRCICLIHMLIMYLLYTLFSADCELSIFLGTLIDWLTDLTDWLIIMGSTSGVQRVLDAQPNELLGCPQQRVFSFNSSHKSFWRPFLSRFS